MGAEGHPAGDHPQDPRRRRRIGNDPAFAQKNLIQRALDPVFGTPDEFAQYLEQSRAQAERTAKKANLQPQ